MGGAIAYTNNQGQVKLVNVRGSRVMPILAELPFIPGNIWHVKPYSGSDSNTGQRPDQALKTLPYAQTAAVANQNDVVLMYAESNTAGSTTDYQSTTLNWAKDGVHLIGVNDGNPFSQRSRIGWASTATTALTSQVPLFSLSANDCLIKNVSFVVGNGQTYLSGGVYVSGDRNVLRNVGIAWPVNTGNDAVGAYAAYFSAAADTLVEDCVMGSYTIDSGSAANSTVLIGAGTGIITFRRDKFIQRLSSSTNTPFIKTVDANSIGFGCVWFEGCGFISTSVNAAHAQTSAMSITAAQASGRVIVDPNCYTNAGSWDNAHTSMVLIGGVLTPTSSAGFGTLYATAA
jgi:hypothetical protein